MTKLKIAIITGSVRKGRFNEPASKWILEEAKKIPEFDVELLDINEYDFPNYEDVPPSRFTDGKYPSEVATRWAAKIKEKDAFIMVTPEYNHSVSGALKNAIDHIYKEWNNKPIAFVSYGSWAGGSRAVEHLRLIAIELQMAPIRVGVHIANYWNSQGDAIFTPYTDVSRQMLEQLRWWTSALKNARE